MNERDWPHPYAEIRRARPGAHTLVATLLAGVGEGARDVARLLETRRKLAPCKVRSVASPASASFDGAQGRIIVTTDACPGESAERLRARGPLPAARVAHIVAAVIEALGAAHAVGVFHRALSLASVVVDGDDVRVIDFGLGELIGSESPHATPRLVALTPERIFGLPASATEDVYLLGCVAYHLITGEPPLVDDDPVRLRRRHAIEDPPRLPRSGPSALPAAFSRVIEKCLAKDADERFADIDALSQAWANATREAGLAAPARSSVAPPPVVGSPKPASPASPRTAIAVGPTTAAPVDPAPSPPRVAATASERSAPRPVPPPPPIARAASERSGASAASERSGARPVSERSGARAASERSGARAASERSGAAAAATSERSAAKPIAAHPVVVPVEPAPQPESAPAIVFPAPGANDPVAPVREDLVAPAVAPLRMIGSAARTSTGSHELAVRSAASPDRPRRRGVIAGVALLAVAIVAAVWIASPGDAPPPVPVADATPTRPIDPPPPPGPPRAEASGDPRPSPPAPIVDAPPVDPIAAVTHGAGEPVAPSDAVLVPDADDAIDPQEVPSTAVAAASTSDVVVAELIARANDSRRAGRTGDAVSAYRDVLARQPGNLEALSAMARIAFDRGAFADAVTWGRRLVAVAPSSAKGRLALGDAYFKLGRLAEAEAQYRKADRLGHRLADSRLAAVGAGRPAGAK